MKGKNLLEHPDFTSGGSSVRLRSPPQIDCSFIETYILVSISFKLSDTTIKVL